MMSSSGKLNSALGDIKNVTLDITKKYSQGKEPESNQQKERCKLWKIHWIGLNFGNIN